MLIFEWNLCNQDVPLKSQLSLSESIPGEWKMLLEKFKFGKKRYFMVLFSAE